VRPLASGGSIVGAVEVVDPLAFHVDQVSSGVRLGQRLGSSIIIATSIVPGPVRRIRSTVFGVAMGKNVGFYWGDRVDGGGVHH